MSEYQTLITGVLAVLAAAATVVTMVLTEMASRDRHETLVRLQKRPEKLLLERAFLPNYWKLHRAAEHFHRLQVGMPKFVDSHLEAQAACSDQMVDAPKQVTEINKIFHLPEWKKAEKLFDGDMLDALNKFLAAGVQLHFSIAAFDNLRRREEMLSSDLGYFRQKPPSEEMIEWWKRAGKEFPDRMFRCSAAVKAVLAEIQRVADLYEITLTINNPLHLTPSPDQS